MENLDTNNNSGQGQPNMEENNPKKLQIILGIVIAFIIVMGVWFGLKQSDGISSPGALNNTNALAQMRISVTGEVVEVNVEENVVDIFEQSSQMTYTVTLLPGSLVLKGGSPISLEEVKVGDLVSALAREEFGEELSIEAQTLRVLQDPFTVPPPAATGL